MWAGQLHRDHGELGPRAHIFSHTGSAVQMIHCVYSEAEVLGFDESIFLAGFWDHPPGWLNRQEQFPLPARVSKFSVFGASTDGNDFAELYHFLVCDGNSSCRVIKFLYNFLSLELTMSM